MQLCPGWDAYHKPASCAHLLPEESSGNAKLLDTSGSPLLIQEAARESHVPKNAGTFIKSEYKIGFKT